MSDTTKIEWAEHTGGPWLGCSMVSPGCTNCYAAELAESRLEHIFRKAYQSAGFEDWRSRPVWGDKAPRVLSKGFWNDAPRINAQHAKAGTRGRWFPSMIDWLDKMPGGMLYQDGYIVKKPIQVLAEFLHVVYESKSLDWLLLTKRPEEFDRQLSFAQDWHFDYGDRTIAGKIADWRRGLAWDNVWIGASVENQEQADKRIPELLKIPARVGFLSVEPLLGPVNLGLGQFTGKTATKVHWVIVGGESGKDARICEPQWIRSIVRQCQAASVPVFVKQLGSNVFWNPSADAPAKYADRVAAFEIKHPKGGDPAEWPEDLRVREYPKL